MAASNYGVVALIQPPSLKSVDQPALIKFETEYTAYKKKVEDVNADRADDDRLILAPIKDCIESSTLHALCILGEIEGANTVEDATAEMVQAWFEQASSSDPKDLSERIDATIRSVSYNPNKADPAGGVANFIIDVIKALDQNNASEVLSDADMAKHFIDRLVHKFEPSVLQERIKMLRKGWKKNQLASIKLFKDEVSNLAVEISLTETARKRVSPRGRPRDPNARRRGLHRPNSDRDKSQDQSRQREDPKRKSSEWSDPCLNPDCKEIHRLKDCKNTSPERKKQLFDELYKNKKSRTAKKAASQDCPMPNAQEGRYRIALEDTIIETVLGDSGADFSAICSSTFKKVKTAMPTLAVKAFEKPLKLVGAFHNDKANDPPFTASASVVLTVTIYLPGSNIPVRVRGIEFYIIDQEMDEILLGRPFLNAIGFNLTDHLLRVHSLIHDKHIDDLDLEELKLASAKYQGLSYMASDDDPIELPECLAAGIGKDQPEYINKAFESIKSKAKDSGISERGLHCLENIFKEYRDVFRIKLGSDPPANVPPLKISLMENAAPYRSPQRRYGQQARDFIVNTIRELEAIGAIYKNPSSRWASPALAVPKPGSNSLRFTVDLRGPNARTIPIQSAMPHLESTFQDIAGSTCFANIDLAHGYWQIPLHEDSQEMMSIQTPLGVYSSRRLLQGGSDSGNHFQAVLSHKFDGRVKKMLQWLDDFLFYAQSEEELFTNIESFLQICKEIGLKLHAEKSTLFANEVQFCGRIISRQGVQYHPRHFHALTSMKTPTMAGELQQFVCATNWMRNSIPNYSQRIALLHHLLEDTYSHVGKRTKHALRNIYITNSWGAIHDAAFADIKQQLAASVKLAHPKSDHHLCLFTDASDTHWAAILTQLPTHDRRKDIEEQNHEPLCFLSGAFSGSAANWSVPEKEGYAIVEAMCRLDYLVMGREVNIFTDHANLVYLYDPYGRNPGISRHTASKLMRWALKLSAFHYVVEHLPGERNVWADMLTRWAVSSNRSINAAKVIKAKSLMYAPINPGIDNTMDWPSFGDIVKSQSKTKELPASSFTNTEQGIKNEKGQLWIPKDDKELQMRIIIAAHTGQGGHRSWRVTLATVQAYCWWSKMAEDIESFVKTCIHCLCTQPGKIVPRPLGHALHAEKPNKLLHFDFCYMSKGEDGYTYVLVFKDDLSGYVWLTPCKETTAEVTAEILIRWFSTFGVVTQWVSDRGSHFKNELVRLLREKLKSSHNFTLAYCPWSNGTVEVVCRELLRVIRALLSEFQLHQSCWPSIMPIVQSALNNTILERLGNRCPLTAFTGLPQDTPLKSITHRIDDVVQVLSCKDLRETQKQNISSLLSALDQMHKEVSIRSSKKRQAAVESHNRKTNIRPINFSEGDYVLRGIVQRESSRKPSLKWHGPFRVVECRSNYIFVIENLLTSKREEVHGRRLKFFRNKDFMVTEELLDHLAYQHGELLVIESFLDIRKHKGIVELLVKWRGFDHNETDWVPHSTLQEDVPTLLSEYLTDVAKTGTQRQRNVVASI